MNRTNARKRSTSVVTGGRQQVTEAYGAGSRIKPQPKAAVVARDKPAMRCRCCPDAKTASTKARPTVTVPRNPQQPLWIPSAAAATPPGEQQTFVRKCYPGSPTGLRSLGSARSPRTETVISRGDGDGLGGDNVTVSHRAARDRGNHHLGHLQCGQGLLKDWREPKEKRFGRLTEETFLEKVVHRRTASTSGSSPSGMLATTTVQQSPTPRILSVSADIGRPQDDIGSRTPDECSLEDETEDNGLLRLLCRFEPLRTAQFLTEELAAKQRELGPAHRQLCQIGKQLSDVVQLLAKQQPASVPIEANRATDTLLQKTPAAAATSELKPGQAKKDEIECCNCALIQRKWDEDRDRHTQETARLSEQINYLQQQLTLAGNIEAGLKRTMAEHQQRLEQKLHELSATVDVKQCLEGPVIRAQRRKLKDTGNRLRDAEQRIADLVEDNNKKELLLLAQDTNIERVKSELQAIRQLSIRQIEYLDQTVDDDTVTTTTTTSAASHRQVPDMNSGPAAFDSRTNTPVVPANYNVFRPGTYQPGTSEPAPDIGLNTAASSFTSSVSLVPDESRMPSVTAAAGSDRDVTSPSASSRFGATLWMSASMLTLCTTSASMWSPVPPDPSVGAMVHNDDDLIAQLTESVTLPSSPVPFDEEEQKENENREVA